MPKSKVIKKESKPNFKDGVLCYVILRPYQGKGRPVLIMHEAKSKEFVYGCFSTWLARPSAVRETLESKHSKNSNIPPYEPAPRNRR